MQKLVKSKVSLPNEIAERDALEEAKLKALADKLQAEPPLKHNPTLQQLGGTLVTEIMEVESGKRVFNRHG
jgi:hypothetical protein